MKEDLIHDGALALNGQCDHPVNGDDASSISLASAVTHEEINSLIAALEFYADPSTYHAIAFMADAPAGEFVEDFAFDDDYRRPMPGKRARATIEAVVQSALARVIAPKPAEHGDLS